GRVRDADVVVGRPDRVVVGAVGPGRRGPGRSEAGPARHGLEQPLVPLVHDLHADYGPAESELHRLSRDELDGAAEVQVRPVRGAGVGEQELPVLEPDRGVPGRHGAVVEDHVRAGRAAEEEGTGAVPPVRLEEGGEAQLEARVEEPLGHLVLGRDEE
ncbi:hypothetical protein THAOC_18466, partial [Thalassiosira oceanica]